MKHRRRLFVLPTLALGATCLLASPAHADQGLNCPDFDSQAEAQEFYDDDPSDPEGLDSDNDGTACETTSYSSSGSASGDGSSDDSTPTGGVAAGAGGLSRAASVPVLPATGAALGTLLIGAGVLATARRRPASQD